MTPTLYEISGDLAALEELLITESGEIDAELEYWFNQVHRDKEAKVDAYCGLMRELESRAAQRKEEATRLMMLSRTDANAAARLKSRLTEFFLTHDIARMDTPRFRLSIAQNGGKLPVVALTDIDKVPDDYVRVVRELDNDAVREAIEAGKDVWFATLGERGMHLRIR